MPHYPSIEWKQRKPSSEFFGPNFIFHTAGTIPREHKSFESPGTDTVASADYPATHNESAKSELNDVGSEGSDGDGGESGGDGGDGGGDESSGSDDDGEPPISPPLVLSWLTISVAISFIFSLSVAALLKTAYALEWPSSYAPD